VSYINFIQSLESFFSQSIVGVLLIEVRVPPLESLEWTILLAVRVLFKEVVDVFFLLFVPGAGSLRQVLDPSDLRLQIYSLVLFFLLLLGEFFHLLFEVRDSVLVAFGSGIQKLQLFCELLNDRVFEYYFLIQVRILFNQVLVYNVVALMYALYLFFLLLNFVQ